MEAVFRIVIPMAMPGLATIGLFLTLGYWNDWFNALMYLESVWILTEKSSVFYGMEIPGVRGLCGRSGACNSSVYGRAYHEENGNLHTIKPFAREKTGL